MKQTLNEYNKPFWVGASDETLFSSKYFHEVAPSKFEIDFAEEMGCAVDVQFAFHSNLGSITVLDRMTGFGFRDTETGYRAPDGKFWLASGHFDVRNLNPETIGDAISLIKENANNCRGE